MRTRKRDGLMFYSSKRLDQSRLAVFCVELVHGHVRYVFGVMTDGYPGQRRLQGEGLRSLTDHLDVGLDDGQWHDVTVLRPLLGEHVLTVDGDVVQVGVQPLTNDFVRKVSFGRCRHSFISVRAG